jgi:hypothetical protein
MYKKIFQLGFGVRDDAILRIEDQTFIPFDPANTDYQQYLKWLEEGNTPLPADTPEQTQ